MAVLSDPVIAHSLQLEELFSAFSLRANQAAWLRQRRMCSSERYVSKGRLQAMLDRELELNTERLGGARGATPRFLPSPTLCVTAGWESSFKAFVPPKAH